MNQFEPLLESFQDICDDCVECGSHQCHPLKCNIKFAKATAEVAAKNGQMVVKNGISMIPKIDMKFYEEGQISKSIALVCKLCKDCNEKHSEECVISLMRRSLESTILKEQRVFPGSTLMYLMNVAKENPSFAEKIKNEFQQKSTL